MENWRRSWDEAALPRELERESEGREQKYSLYSTHFRIKHTLPGVSIHSFDFAR